MKAKVRYQAGLNIFLLFLFSLDLGAQMISGSLETRANFFIRDSTIGAANTPQYDRQLYGAESWLYLNYSNWGFDFQLRYDLFNNSNLRDPNASLTNQGLGMFQIRKKMDKLDITAGYIYDQIASGIIYRAYEDRSQLIDNALKGVRLIYRWNDNWAAKAFTGRQKRLFEEYQSVIKGFSLDGYIPFGGEERTWSLAPGFGLVNRTFDDATMRSVVAALETYDSSRVFIPKHNAYAMSLYNLLAAPSFSWYAELALKLNDTQNDPVLERMIGDNGILMYTSFSYYMPGFAITVEGKRTKAFDYRTRPQEVLNRGQINFIPPLARENSYRLTTRYQPATQFVGEQGGQVTLQYSPHNKLIFELNFSTIYDLDNTLLYRELYFQNTIRRKRKWTLTSGLQVLSYNQDRYQVKPGVPMVEAIVPFAEFQYKFDRKKSLKLDLEYMATDQDLGSWVFALLEYAVAPHWSFELSDMYNLASDQIPANTTGINKHYPTAGIVYAKHANRFSLRYVKQVEGIVCSGGICRLEPAFSGFRFTVNSSF